jgi:hypothetical protein
MASPRQQREAVGLFRCGDPQGRMFDVSPAHNRDFVNDKWIALKARFGELGVRLDPAGTAGAFELHLNAQPLVSAGIPVYLLMAETAQVYPPNGDVQMHATYRRIFTWNDDLAGLGKYIKFNFGHRLMVPEVTGFAGRDTLCCMISGNKILSVRTPLDLYSERIRTIRWFERHAPRDFDLYGMEWNAPARRPGFAWGMAHRLSLRLADPSSRLFFPSFRGRIESKLETGRKYRFSICYENVRDLPGYITEKIFDAFCAGMVPVYWGAPNVTQYIPQECFLDRREFATHEALHARLTQMSEAEYRERQAAIAAFLSGSGSAQFTAEHFARTIADAIAADLRESNVAH